MMEERVCADGAAISRRALLTAVPAIAAPAAGLAVTLAGAAPLQANTETPGMALFREWVRLDNEVVAVFSRSDDEAAQDAAIEAKDAVERKMIETDRLTHLDVICTIVALTDYGFFGLNDGDQKVLREEVRRLLTNEI